MTWWRWALFCFVGGKVEREKGRNDTAKESPFFAEIKNSQKSYGRWYPKKLKVKREIIVTNFFWFSQEPLYSYVSIPPLWTREFCHLSLTKPAGFVSTWLNHQATVLSVQYHQASRYGWGDRGGYRRSWWKQPERTMGTGRNGVISWEKGRMFISLVEQGEWKLIF